MGGEEEEVVEGNESEGRGKANRGVAFGGSFRGVKGGRGGACCCSADCRQCWSSMWQVAEPFPR